MIKLFSQIQSLYQKSDHAELYALASRVIEKEKFSDPEAWLKIAWLTLKPPIADHIKTLECLEKAFNLGPDNPTTWILFAFTYEYACLGPLDEKHYLKIISLSDSISDLEFRSMLKYAASWYCSYHKKNPRIEEMLLLESIQLYDKDVNNYLHLARLYLNNERFLQALPYFKKAISNVKKIYCDNEIRNPSDINEFLNEMIRGIHLTNVVYNSFCEELKECEEMCREGI